MALFKLRKGGDEAAATARQPESIEAIRRRAKNRLIGAAVLVLLGIIGFPVLFDTQPRPIAVDIPIEIPDRNKVRPLPAPSPTAGPIAEGPAASAVAKASEAPAKTEAKPDAKPDARPEKAEAKAAPADDGAKAQALLEAKPTATSSAAPAEGRFIVQVGAFADLSKAREARVRLEKAGLKTYTTVTETKDGKRVRVRVGPFQTRAEADKAAGKIKGLDLPAAILVL